MFVSVAERARTDTRQGGWFQDAGSEWICHHSSNSATLEFCQRPLDSYQGSNPFVITTSPPSGKCAALSSFK
eukprot:15472422-Alexandrium_andersonii.AAC.1